MARLLGLMSVVYLVALIAVNVVSCRKDFNKFLYSMYDDEGAGNGEVETLFDTPTKPGMGDCTKPSGERTKMMCYEMDRKVWVFSTNKNQCVAIYVDCNVFDGDLHEKKSECIRSCILG